jgi:hypothetical protein
LNERKEEGKMKKRVHEIILPLMLALTVLVVVTRLFGCVYASTQVTITKVIEHNTGTVDVTVKNTRTVDVTVNVSSWVNGHIDNENGQGGSAKLDVDASSSATQRGLNTVVEGANDQWVTVRDSYGDYAIMYNTNNNWTFTTNGTSSVGGNVVPVDKLALLAPYVGLASTTIIAAIATAVCVKRVKRRKEK